MPLLVVMWASLLAQKKLETFFTYTKKCRVPTVNQSPDMISMSLMSVAASETGVLGQRILLKYQVI